MFVDAANLQISNKVLKLIGDCRENVGRIRVFSIKVALATMCAGKLMDKLRCKSPNYLSTRPAKLAIPSFRYFLANFRRQRPHDSCEVLRVPAGGAGPPRRRLRVALVQLLGHARSLHL